MILNEILNAFGYVVIAGILGIAYSLAKNSSNNRKGTLLKGLLWCAGIAFVLSLYLGDPTCIDQEYDTRGTICNEYADDGFTPTLEQRISKFAYYLTLLYPPVVLAAFGKPKVIEKKERAPTSAL